MNFFNKLIFVSMMTEGLYKNIQFEYLFCSLSINQMLFRALFASLEDGAHMIFYYVNHYFIYFLDIPPPGMGVPPPMFQPGPPPGK